MVIFKKQTSIRARFVKTISLILTGFFLLILVGTALLELFRVNANTRNGLKNDLALRINQINWRFDYIVESAINYANSSLIINSLVDNIDSASYLQSSMSDFARQEEIKNLIMFDYAGNIVRYTSKSKPTWYNKEVIGLTLNEAATMFISNPDNMEIVIIIPINYYDTPQGAIAVELDFNLLLSRTLSNGSYAYRILIDNTYLSVFGALPDEEILESEYLKLSNQHQTNINYKILAIAPKSLISDAALSLIGEILFTGIIGVTFSLIIASQVGKKLSSPITNLIKKIQSNTHPCRPVGTNDELENLAFAFDEKTEALLRINNDLENRVAQRTEELELQQQKLEKLNDELESKQEILVKTNAILETSNRQLMESNEELDRYAFVSSHDLKSPLQAIEQLSKWIEEDCADLLPEESKRHFSLLKARTERMKVLLSDMYTYSKIKHEESSYESISLDPFIENIFELVAPPINVNFHKDNCSNNASLPRIPLDTCLRNLLSNAIKHHNKEVVNINIRYEKNSSYHIFTVSDDGPGIPPELQEKALEMFHTLKSRDDIEGSGLGLSIVKKYIEKYKGKIVINSDGTSGTHISLYWPIDFPIQETKTL